MNTTPVLATVILASGVFSEKVDAAISITNLTLTTNSVSFHITGTMPSILPYASADAFFFVNPNPAANLGFALGNFMLSNSRSFTGSQAFRESLNPIATRGVTFGDYFYVVFETGLSALEAISGTLTASWSGAAFNPAAVSELNVYWGSDTRLPQQPWTQPSWITGGTFLGNYSVVPEPSAVLLTTLGSLALLRRSRKI